MTAQPVTTTPGTGTPVVFRYALMPVDGNGIAVPPVAAMLDNGAGGAQARVLAPGEVLPYGTVPVLVTDTTVYGVTRLGRPCCAGGRCQASSVEPKKTSLWSVRAFPEVCR
ncbi:hypothetical protein GCM10018772_61660 [Streptomyces fumanus]|uniref:Uncharacterized protein n=1 Tax=Streptomyces fumanus TaxID=67302 RepID=A0A919AUU3_9ACTN|nr:hypothetical protein GCM10018772_61660 [Streptomyces fumanus]